MNHEGSQRAQRPAERELARRALMRFDDADLVVRACAGQEAAFAVLMDRYTPSVLGFLVNRLRTAQGTEDLAQETFLAAYRNLDRLREPARFGPWLMQIARSKMMDQLRADRRGGVELVPLEPGDASPVEYMADPGPTPGEEAWRGQLTLLIVDTIEGMAERYRAVLYPRLIGDESTTDIARRLHLRPNTVRQRLVRGMRKLRRALEKAGLDGDDTWATLLHGEGEGD